MLYQLKSFSSQATENPTQTNLRKKKKKTWVHLSEKLNFFQS